MDRSLKKLAITNFEDYHYLPTVIIEDTNFEVQN